MKNIIIAAAVGISAVSFNAQAADSTQACGMFENETRFNPTSLSDYQECWLDFHYPDKTSGTLGSLFWTKIGDQFISMPIKDLVRAGSAENAKKVVYKKIIDTALVDQLTEELAKAGMKIIALQGEIKTLTDARDALVAAGVTQTAIDALNTKITAKDSEIRQLTADLTTARAERDLADGRANTLRSQRDQAIARANRVDNTEHATEYAAYAAGAMQARGSQMSTDASEAAHGVALYVASQVESITHENYVYTADFRAAVDALRTNFTSANVREVVRIGIGQIPATVIMPTPPVSVADEDGDGLSITDIDVYVENGLTTYHQDPENGEYTMLVDRPFLDLVARDNWNNPNEIKITLDGYQDGPALYVVFHSALHLSIEVAVETAYKDGYNAGYDAGYRDGYNDGFRDGVASVS